MEPNPGDTYNEGYEAGYKAGKADTEKAVKEERKRMVQNLPSYVHEGLSDQAIYGWNLCRNRILQALTPTKTDKQ